MSKILKKQCDKLWGKIIILKAGFKSEVSGKEGYQIGGHYILNSHHIVKKPNYRLRYEISNGICLTKWEHRYGIHGNHEEEYRELIKRIKGQDIYERLNLLRSATSPTLDLIKIYLEQELEKLKAFIK